ncbi:hypothetical protein RsoM2USA_388 [Ralstonia phage RsoM2USA]|nr:hypothetical protein RsoM2USA_388 [Ralstonia phage RsoM2USA]
MIFARASGKVVATLFITSCVTLPASAMLPPNSFFLRVTFIGQHLIPDGVHRHHCKVRCQTCMRALIQNIMHLTRLHINSIGQSRQLHGNSRVNLRARCLRQSFQDAGVLICVFFKFIHSITQLFH